jgi:hypothetical protein
MEFFAGKSVAIVGSAPSVLENEPGFVDSHDVVCRANNFKLGHNQGFRCDVFYSFFGGSIRKTVAELMACGVKICMSKVPNAKPIQSPWHEANHKQNGIDFRYIYDARRDWWFGDVFVPSTEWFMASFELLGRHIPTTGFAAILDVIECAPKSVYLTGFDFMRSGVHNVDEKWRKGDPSDPIGHRPELEFAWLVENARRYPLTFDPTLAAMVLEARAGVAA